MTKALLEIRYTNETTFKYVHDLIQEHDPYGVIFIEEPDGVSPNVVFEIANLLQLFKPDLMLGFKSERIELPTEDLDPNLLFQGIPFTHINLNGIMYTCCDKTGKIIKIE